MKCQNCGDELQAGTKFCTKCGATVLEPEITETPAEKESTLELPKPSVPKKADAPPLELPAAPKPKPEPAPPKPAGPPPPNYGASRGYGAPPTPGYGAPPAGYGAPPPVYTAPQPVFVQPVPYPVPVAYAAPLPPQPSKVLPWNKGLVFLMRAFALLIAVLAIASPFMKLFEVMSPEIFEGYKASSVFQLSSLFDNNSFDYGPILPVMAYVMYIPCLVGCGITLFVSFFFIGNRDIRQSKHYYSMTSTITSLFLIAHFIMLAFVLFSSGTEKMDIFVTDWEWVKVTPMYWVVMGTSLVGFLVVNAVASYYKRRLNEEKSGTLSGGYWK